ncbi:MAG: hypothetical protein WBI12_00600 [Methanosarcina flavescens]|jgi:hypothetical protein|uniref:Uncharacterized protein n=1 Tax=Methanosarcina flavescens TaxID=1715806 RepID=A0A660HPE6_9EURY|nr:hypothetical protein [Methanosarcina flavescens]AYK14140.1 hypothetical protein AOB57_002060 [Methanosarcina flavescens]
MKVYDEVYFKIELEYYLQANKGCVLKLRSGKFNLSKPSEAILTINLIKESKISGNEIKKKIMEQNSV